MARNSIDFVEKKNGLASELRKKRVSSMNDVGAMTKLSNRDLYGSYMSANYGTKKV